MGRPEVRGPLFEARKGVDGMRLEEVGERSTELLQTEYRVKQLKEQLAERADKLGLVVEALRAGPDEVYFKNPDEASGLPKHHQDPQNATVFEWRDVDLALTGRMSAELAFAQQHAEHLKRMLDPIIRAPRVGGDG